MWASIRVLSPLLSLETTLNDLSGRMFDISPPEYPILLPFLYLTSDDSDTHNLIHVVWGPFEDQESVIAEYVICLEVMDPVSLTRLTEEVCITVNSSVYFQVFPFTLNISSTIQARVAARNEANLTTVVSSNSMVIDMTSPHCSDRKVYVQDLYTVAANSSSSIFSTIIVSWDACVDNESDVEYRIVVESCDAPSDSLEDQPMHLLASEVIRNGRSVIGDSALAAPAGPQLGVSTPLSSVLVLGMVENGKRLRISLDASSPGGISQMTASFIAIDFTPPVLGHVRLTTDSADPNYHNKLDFFAATWPFPFDNESELVSCNFSINLANGPALHSWELPIDSTEIASYGPWFEYGLSYTLVLACSNEKGLVSTSSSIPFLIPSCPIIGTILHGEHCSSAPFVNDTSKIQAC